MAGSQGPNAVLRHRGKPAIETQVNAAGSFAVSAPVRPDALRLIKDGIAIGGLGPDFSDFGV